MKIKDFIPSLHKQIGKILQRDDGTIWTVNAIDYREGILYLNELTSMPFETVTMKLNIFSKELIENFKEMEIIK